MSTPHINAKKGDFAEGVILPGDPLRAKFIAENFITNAKEVCNVRNILGFTGEYKGKPVSVMGTGMGIPSISIYATELAKNFGVKTMIRTGTCGALHDDLNLMDIVLCMGAGTDSGFHKSFIGNMHYPFIANFELLEKAKNIAKNNDLSYKIGKMFTSDLFYRNDLEYNSLLTKLGFLAVEMEIAGLYKVADDYGVKALGITTVSDHINKGGKLSSSDREKSLEQMISIALETIHEE